MSSLLLVDDETIVAAEFARTLEVFGFKVEIAVDLESGISHVQAAKYDAILVEFNLRSERSPHPRTGKGLQFVRQFRAMGVLAPVLTFTAMEGEFYEVASLNAGADDFILKTTSIPGLVSRVWAHIHRYRKSLDETTGR